MTELIERLALSLWVGMLSGIGIGWFLYGDAQGVLLGLVLGMVFMPIGAAISFWQWKKEGVNL